MPRSLIALAAAFTLAGAPAASALSPVERVIAQTEETESNLSQTPPTSGLSAQNEPEAGSLTSDPPSVPGRQEAREQSGELPFTGSDPLMTLLLGGAALLTGAGLRLRTGDARDY